MLDETLERTVYEKLNEAWKKTCKIILGDEIGELKDYEAYLSEYLWPLEKRSSYKSGKPVYLVSPFFPKTARYVSYDEIQNCTFSPLTIDEIKDIDSIVEALSERWVYVGNTIMGNSEKIMNPRLYLMVDSHIMLVNLEILK